MIPKQSIHDIYVAKRDELNMITLSLPIRACVLKYPTFIESLYEKVEHGQESELPNYISNIGLTKLYICIFYYILMNKAEYKDVDQHFKIMQKSKEIFAYERDDDSDLELTIKVLNIYESFIFKCLEVKSNRREFTTKDSVKTDTNENDDRKINEIKCKQKKLIQQLEKMNLY